MTGRIHSPPEDLASRRVGVYGLGTSGAAAARLLRALGAEVRLLDDGTPDPRRLEELGLGDLPAPTPPGDLEGIEVLVVSPGIPPGAPGRVAAGTAGIPVMGELELAARDLGERLIVVTGSHGKSTVTSWIAGLLRAAGRSAVACGNLGTPLAELVLAGDLPEHIVVEASSFQLHDSPGLEAAAAVFTAYAPNHLDWHPDEDDYRESKLGLVERLLPGSRVSFLPGFPGLAGRLEGRDLELSPVGEGADFGWGEGAPGEVRTPRGTLDLATLEDGARLASLAPSIALAAAAAEAGPVEIRRAAGEVAALPHRLEDLGVRAGVRYVNDSKATTPAAAAYALGRVQPPVVLILGGKDKGLSFSDFVEVFSRAEHLVFTGAARPRLARELASLPSSEVEDFEEALREATGRCPAGGTVLLAPGCSSYDCFRSFEERGETFRAYVCGLPEGEAA